MSSTDRTLLYLSTDPGIPVFGHKGSSTHVREMARAFAGLGWQVWLATTGPVESVPAGFPCRVERLPGLRGSGWRRLGFDGRLWLASRLAIGRLDSLIQEIRPQFIYERYALYGTAGEKLARRHRLSRVVEVNAFLSEEARTRLHFPAWARRVEQSLLRTAPALTAISRVMKERLVKELGIPAERILLSPMGMDPERFHPQVKSRPEADVLRGGVSGGRGFLIGYIGSFNSYHRPSWLLDLAEGLGAKGLEARIVVIGGPIPKVERHREEARRRGIEGWFHYVGELPHQDLPSWLAALDLAVVPGAAPQSSPTKIVEAAAVGVPQIIPDTPPIRYLAGSLGEWAFFAPENREEFIGRVSEALGRLEACRKEARACAPETAAHHSWRRRAEDILERVASLRGPAEGCTPS